MILKEIIKQEINELFRQNKVSKIEGESIVLNSHFLIKKFTIQKKIILKPLRHLFLSSFFGKAPKTLKSYEEDILIDISDISLYFYPKENDLFEYSFNPNKYKFLGLSQIDKLLYMIYSENGKIIISKIITEDVFFKNFIDIMAMFIDCSNDYLTQFETVGLNSNFKISYKKVGEKFEKKNSTNKINYTNLVYGAIGHWRNQPIGEGRTNSKLIWISDQIKRRHL